MRAVTVREPEFSADDLAALIVSRRDSLVRRGPHGHPLSEATDPANQFKYYVEHPIQDWALTAAQRAQDHFYAANPQLKKDSTLIFPVKKRP